MARFHAEFDVDAAPEKVFEYLREPANRVEWDPSVRSVEVNPVEVDDSVTLTVGFYGRPIEAAYRLVDADAGVRLEFALDGKVQGRETFVLTSTGTGTHIEMELDIGLRGPARLLDRGLQLALGGIGENAVKGLLKALGARRVG